MNCFFEILGGYGLLRYKFCLEGKTFRSAGARKAMVKSSLAPSEPLRASIPAALRALAELAFRFRLGAVGAGF